MPLKRQAAEAAAVATVLLAAFFSAACPSDSGRTVPAPPAVPANAQAAARAAYGSDGEALAYGDFAAAGGPHVLAIRRLAAAAQPGSAASGSSPPAQGGSAPAGSAQTPETAVDVIGVSILMRDGTNWKEAFRADEHLKNRRGYLGGTPAVPVPAWHMGYEKTADSGFRLEFTPLNLSPGLKPVIVRVAWNAKRQEYDSLDASGKGFLEPRATPGGASLKMEK